MTEGDIIVENSRLYWLFTFDSIKLPNSLRDVSNYLAQSPLVQSWSYYYSPEERHLGLGKIETKNPDENKIINSIEDILNEPKNLLEVFQDTDFHVLDEEFFEAQIYTRFYLKGFKIRLPHLKDPKDVIVTLMLTKYGVGCLSFGINLDEPLTPVQLAEIQTIPKNEDPIIGVSIGLELIEELAECEPDLHVILEKRKAQGKNNVVYKQISLGMVTYWYMASIINLCQNRKFDKLTDIAKNQRYETYIPHPVLIIEKTLPEYNSAFDLVVNHPRQIYQISEQLMFIDKNDVSISATSKMTNVTLTDREDIWYYATIGTSLQILTPRSFELAKLRNKDKNPYDNYLKDILQAVVENEIVSIQRFIVLMLEHLISISDITSMEPRDISLLKETIMKSLEIFHGIRVVGNTISYDRIEFGKEATLVNLVYKTIENKIILMDESVKDYQESLKDFTQTVLGIILGVVPVLILVLPESYSSITPEIMSLLKIILSAGLSGLLAFLARWGAKKYWKMKQIKDSYV